MTWPGCGQGCDGSPRCHLAAENRSRGQTGTILGSNRGDSGPPGPHEAAAGAAPGRGARRGPATGTQRRGGAGAAPPGARRFGAGRGRDGTGGQGPVPARRRPALTARPATPWPGASLLPRPGPAPRLRRRRFRFRLATTPRRGRFRARCRKSRPALLNGGGKGSGAAA